MQLDVTIKLKDGKEVTPATIKNALEFSPFKDRLISVREVGSPEEEAEGAGATEEVAAQAGSQQAT